MPQVPAAAVPRVPGGVAAGAAGAGRSGRCGGRAGRRARRGSRVRVRVRVHSTPRAPSRRRPSPRWQPGQGQRRQRVRDVSAPQGRQRPPEQAQPAATARHREHGEARDAARRFRSSVWQARLPEQLQAPPPPALLLSQQHQPRQHLRPHLRQMPPWRRWPEPRTEPPPVPELLPLAAKVHRPARAAGRGEAAAPPRRLESPPGPARTAPHPAPFPGQQPGRRGGGAGEGAAAAADSTPETDVDRSAASAPLLPLLPLLPWQCVRAPGLLEARVRHLRRAAGPAGWTETELPSLLLPGLKCANELGNNLEDVADHTVVRDLEDRRVPVLVDGDDHLRGLHAGPVLDRAGNAQRDIQLW